MYSVIEPDIVKYLLDSNSISPQVQGGICRGDPGINKVPNTVACVVVLIYTHIHAHRNYPIHRRWVDMPGTVGCRKILIELLNTFVPGRGSRFQTSPLTLHNQKFVGSLLSRRILVRMQIGKPPLPRLASMTVLGACHIALLGGELPCKDGVPDTIQDTLGSSPRNAPDLLLNGGNIVIVLIILILVTRNLVNA